MFTFYNPSIIMIIYEHDLGLTTKDWASASFVTSIWIYVCIYFLQMKFTIYLQYIYLLHIFVYKVYKVDISYTTVSSI